MTIYAINPLEQDQALPAVSTDSTACSITSINVLCMAIASQEILIDICTMDKNRVANSPSPIQMTPMVSSAFQLGNSIRPDFFTPDVPDDFFDPSQSAGEDIITKLYQMIMYLNQRPDDIEAVKIFYKFLQNLSAKGWLDGSDSRVAQMLNSLTINGKPVYLAVIDILGQAHYFDTQSKDWDAAFWDSLKFQGHNTISDSINQYIESIRTGQKIGEFPPDWNWADFVSKYSKDGKPQYTADEWMWVAGGRWGEGICQHSSIAQWAKSMRLWMFDAIINSPGGKDMALELAYMLLLTLSSSDSYNDIAGFGAMGRFFADRTKDISEIVDLWKNPGSADLSKIQEIVDFWKSQKTTDDAGFHFMEMIENLKISIDQSSSYTPDVKEALKKQIGIIENDGFIGTFLYTYKVATGQEIDRDMTAQQAREYLNVCYESCVKKLSKTGERLHGQIDAALNTLFSISVDALNPGMHFMDMIENLRFKIENSPFSAKMKESFLKQLNEIENINIQGASWKELYDIAKGNIPPWPGLTPEDAKRFLYAEFNNVSKYKPDPDSKDPDFDAKFKNAFETIDYKLKSMSNCLTDQSQQQTTQLTKLTNDSEAELNMFNKCLNGETGILGLLNQLIRNQKGQ